MPEQGSGCQHQAADASIGQRMLASGGDKSAASKNLQSLQKNTLNALLTTNAHYVEDRARKLSAGNLLRAEEIINSSGYHVRGQATPYNPAFQEVESGEGWAKWRTVKESGSYATGFLWRYGLTDKKNTPPDAGNLITHHTPTQSIKISGFRSGAIVAIQFAQNELAGRIKRSTPSYNHNDPDPYDWSDFIYTVIP